MEKMKPQSYATHRRWEPLFHFFALPALLLMFPAWSIVHLYRHYPAPQSFVFLVFAFAIAVLAVYARVFALRVQDRLIALEERLRLEKTLSPEARAAAQLTDDQLIGLRFASDEEVADLVAAACAEKLTREQIKKRVKSWRPDYRRA